MPINYDAEFVTNIVEAVRYVLEFLTMLLKSIVFDQSEKLPQTADGIWGAIYWLIKDVNVILDSVFTSTVEVTFRDIPSLNISNLIGDAEATRGATYFLNATLYELASNEGGITTSMLYHLFDFLSYLIRFGGEVMQLLPDVFPLA